jgi:Zn finger protein HypA/HybF involved in hydrogenase expression
MIASEPGEFECVNCLHEWTVPNGAVGPSNCPRCGSERIGRPSDDRAPRMREMPTVAGRAGMTR